MNVRIRASAIDPDGSISEVRFFADTNLVGVATQKPYEILWLVGNNGNEGGQTKLKAVAVDNEGATVESSSTVTYYTGGPPGPTFEIVSPRNGAILAAPATFILTAELLASPGSAGSVDFFIGPNRLRVERDDSFTATTPPYSLTISNLAEGTYELSLAPLNYSYFKILHWPVTIKVVRLGINLPELTSDGQRVQFDGVTSFPNNETVIQVSTNLRDWASISTIVPGANSFRFVDPNPLNGSQRFYRLQVPQ